jgi:hypothetical protein
MVQRRAFNLGRAKAAPLQVSLLFYAFPPPPSLWRDKFLRLLFDCLKLRPRLLNLKLENRTRRLTQPYKDTKKAR